MERENVNDAEHETMTMRAGTVNANGRTLGAADCNHS